MGEETDARVACDNDLLYKAICYRISRVLWPDPAVVGVLGSARYVIRGLLDTASLVARESALEEFDNVFASVVPLEPTDEEVRLAAELEVAAQRGGLQLDAGESQLVAIVVAREITAFETGDKRAIAALEGLLTAVAAVRSLAHRVRCLEQLILDRITDSAICTRIRQAVCSERDVDKALTMSFACFTPGDVDETVVSPGLRSYIQDLRRTAPQILAT